MKIGLAQINPTVGDLEGNASKIAEYIELARGKADLLVFPELTITGYPPKDLLLKPSFIARNRALLQEIVERTRGIAAIIGFVDEEEGGIYNAAAVAIEGEMVGVYRKIFLPNYDVFDEKRYFKPGVELGVFEIEGLKIGVSVCEDIWVEKGPFQSQARSGAELLVNISASPFHAGKMRERIELLARRARETGLPLVYCNLVGGQDDLVFDGGSCVLNARGALIAMARRFREELLLTELAGGEARLEEQEGVAEVYEALVLGIRDYVRKNGFRKVVIGLSGGIDSSLTAVLATRALGAESVIGVFMPSRFTSMESREDVEALAGRLGIELKVIPIDRAVKAYREMLAEEFEGLGEDVTEENIQARIRGNILMALSNKFGYLVLSTGNKSEMAVGYTTLYGDMAGGLAVLSDVPKTMVYQLAKYVNSTGGEPIPGRVLVKEPSAELRENQRDAEDLPPYEILDPILQAYIEENKSMDEIVALGFEREVVEEVIGRVDRNEHKRKQAPLGIKVTSKAFGSGRRMPITNRYRG